MVSSLRLGLGLLALLLLAATGHAQESGSIRGFVFDKDFEAPLFEAKVQITETGAEANTSAQGNYSFVGVAPGTYTLVFSKDGYVKQVRSKVLVKPGELRDIDVHLAGEFTEMEEFVVEQALSLGGESEQALLELRFESAALLDSIGAELMSQAGASDAAAAIKLAAFVAAGSAMADAWVCGGQEGLYELVGHPAFEILEVYPDDIHQVAEKVDQLKDLLESMR